MPLSQELIAEGLAELVDKTHIRELFARLARAVDRVDAEGIKACYTTDSFDNHGSFNGTGAEFAVRPSRQLPSNIASFHLLGQPNIDLRGDEAFCETYFFGPLVQLVDGEYIEIQSMGRYLDHVARVDGTLLIKYRCVTLDWGSARPAAEWEELSAFIRGRRFPDDDVFHPDQWAPIR